MQLKVPPRTSCVSLRKALKSSELGFPSQMRTLKVPPHCCYKGKTKERESAPSTEPGTRETLLL